jgi:hypothetical protein
MDIYILHDTFFINNKYRPLRTAFIFPEGTILPGNLTVGPKIAQQRISYSTQAFCPGFQNRYMVNAYAQNLDI